MEVMTKEETLNILSRLYSYEPLFYNFWEIGSVQFCEKIPTACVSFLVKNGSPVEFRINKSFWETLSDIQKDFIVCHEMMHVFLDHGRRSIGLDDRLSNIAEDIVINHLLLDALHTTIDDIDPERKFCWIETVFKDNADEILKDQSFIYYYNKILNIDLPVDVNKLLLIGGHDFNSDGGSRISTGEAMTPEEIQEFINGFINDNPDVGQFIEQISSGVSTSELDIRGEVLKKKKPWESVIKKWVQKRLKESSDVEDCWVGKNRRFTLLNNSMILPNVFEKEKRENDKITVWFLQDTSGSCIGYAKRFFAAAKTIPSDKIDVRAACFDTSVYPISLDNVKVRGGGGNNGTCMERYIQKTIKLENIPYPDAVFLMSDGHVFEPVIVEHPDRWFWFMPQRGSTVRYLDKRMHTFDLGDFV